MDDSFRTVLGPDDEGRRLDRILRIALRTVPLSAIHRSLRKGSIRVNGLKKAPDYRCREGDVLEGSLTSFPGLPSRLPIAAGSAPPPVRLTPPLLLLETRDLIFINKPLGMLVHGGAESLEAIVKNHLAAKIEDSLSFSPGPLHRLDRNTSGIVTFPGSMAGARDFSAALRGGDVQKTYIALFSGLLPGLARWQDQMRRDRVSRTSHAGDRPEGGGRGDEIGEARTTVAPLLFNESATLAAVTLETGRTHQIRAQAAHHGHPLLGDSKYGGGREGGGYPYYLHAWKLEFGKKLFADLPPVVRAPLPEYFQKMIETIFAAEANRVYSTLRQLRT